MTKYKRNKKKYYKKTKSNAKKKINIIIKITKNDMKKIARYQYRALSDEEKIRKESKEEIGIGICLKTANKS